MINSNSINGDKNDWARLCILVKKYARPYWKEIFFLIGLNFIVTISTSVMPLLIAPILNISIGNPAAISAVKDKLSLVDALSLNNLGYVMLDLFNLKHAHAFTAVLWLAMGYFIAALVKGLTSFAAYIMALRIRVNSARDMQKDLFQHILSLSMSFFAKQKTGEIISRMEKDTLGTTSGLVDNIIAQALTSPLLIIFYGVILFRTSYVLALVGIFGAILQLIVSKSITNPIRRYVSDQFNIFADLSSRLQETILSIRIVKSFAAEKFEFKRLSEEIAKVVKINMKFGVFRHIEEPARLFANTIIEIIILLFSVNELLHGRLTMPAFFMFIFIGRAIMEPIVKLAATIPAIQSTIASSERVYQIFSTLPAVQDGEQRKTVFLDKIVINNVSFRYVKSPVIQNLSLVIKKGEVVALVGPSGAGKSTLADLILRFYDPNEGEIIIDNVDLRNLIQTKYRRLFGVVPQEALLFNANIWDNIRYGREDISDKDVVEAAKVANAQEFITHLPNGYDSLIGDRGIRLSGGQKQRIAIARAVVHRPEILILDEATSSLDSESELLVQNAIQKVIKNNTAIIIAHRLSTVVHADKIVVMDKGEIIDQGRHSELIERCELYKNLCRLQFGKKSYMENYDLRLMKGI